MRKKQRVRISPKKAVKKVARCLAEPLENRLLLAAQMVGDLAPGTPGSNPSAMLNHNGSLFFIADDGVHGSELWKSDGTPAGTQLVKDIQPGAVGALKGSWLTNFNGAVYFAADDGVNGRELWKSDGTAAGTAMVADIYSGSAGSDPGIASSEDPRTHLVVGSTLFFHAADSKGDELWKTDGTRKGTVMVKDINPASGQVNGSYAGSMTALNGLLLFRAYTGGKYTLFRSDGTAAGTFPLESGAQVITDPKELTVSAGAAYFVSTIPNNPDMLFRTDGTVAGTSAVANAQGRISDLTDVNDSLYCVLYSFIGAGSYVLSKFDPVAKQISAVVPVTSTSPSLARNLTASNGLIYFKARVDNVWGLWRSDGSPAGTTLIKAVTPDAPADGAYNPYGDGFIFYGTDATGEALWKSDGTAAGTTPIKSMDLPQANYQNIGTALAIGQTFYFAAVADPLNGVELWKTDGTAAGTVLVKDINTAGFSLNPTAGGEAGGIAYFGANTYQLWRSDGTPAGTFNTDTSSPSNFLATSDSLYFAAIRPGSGSKVLWRVDGGGMIQLLPPVGGQAPTDLTNLNGTIYFAAQQITGPYRTLWKTDGTVTGTVTVSSVPGNPAGLVAMGDRIYFSALSDSGTELWASDGTTAGTSLLKDLLPGTASSNPRSLTVVGDTLYFLADGLQGATALWKSDGTAQGTTLVTSLTDTLASNFTAVNGLLLFLRSDPNTGRELWESDGTPQGTKLVRDIVPGPGSSKISNLLVVGNTLFFQANDSTHGAELWKTDGTEQATQMVADIAPGFDGSNPVPGINANGLLIFSANDLVHGTELWGSDGTTAGTSLLADINPGPAGSNAGGFTIANGVLFFGANDGVHGNELWKYLDIPQRLRAEANGPYNVSEGQSVALSSFGSTGAISAYEWDFDYDPAAGFVVDATGPAPSFDGLDGPSTHVVALRLRSATGEVSIDTAQIFVGNVAPTPAASGPQSISAGVPYVLQLAYADPGQDSPQSWKVEWGDGSVETFQGSPESVSHVYSQAGWHSVYAWVTDDDSTYAIKPQNLAVGALDPAFNGTGVLPFPDRIMDMQQLSDGKLLVLGVDWSVFRLNRDGTPDLTFGGGDGAIHPGIDAPLQPKASAAAMALRPDGSFVLAGTYRDPNASYTAGVVAQFNADGTADTSFQTSGGWAGGLADVAIADDGKVLLAGWESGKMLVIRLNSDGTPDQGFGPNGVRLVFTTSGTTGMWVKPLSDGVVLLGGAVGSAGGEEIGLARLTANGTPDPTFAGDGTTIMGISPSINTSTQPSNFLVQDDGKILVVGRTLFWSSPYTGPLAIVRFNADGTLDQSFNGTGYNVTGVNSDTVGNSIAVDPSGRIVVGGRAGSTFALFRYLPDGRLDPDFADGGKLVTTDPNVIGSTTRLVLPADGRILVSATGGNQDFIMQLVQSPLSVQVLPAAPPVPAVKVLTSGSPAGNDLLTDTQPLLKPQKQTSLFSSQRIVQKPAIKPPPVRPTPGHA
jgi:uncharacterized delta-60 repeat protein